MALQFTLPQLKYKYDDLEPSIDTKTMETHHTKHHQAYVDGVNKLSNAVPAELCLQDLLEDLKKNNGFSETDKDILLRFGGGHYNHSLFWEYMSSHSSEADIAMSLMGRISIDFQSLEEFKKAFDTKSIAVFGSGWTWWVYDKETGKSHIVNTQNQDNPIMENPNLTCLLGLDVWEHAYYLKYQNRRVEYVNSFWKIVNWKMVSMIYDHVTMPGRKIEVDNNGYVHFK